VTKLEVVARGGVGCREGSIEEVHEGHKSIAHVGMKEPSVADQGHPSLDRDTDELDRIKRLAVPYRHIDRAP